MAHSKALGKKGLKYKSKRARLCCEHISTREEGEIMSVTVSDLLKLPSLQQARVIGGAGGLKKVVSSISVLESTDPGVLIN